MTKKLCTFGGCNKIVDHADDGTSPRCDKHKTKERNTTTRTAKIISYNADSFYNTYAWKKVRSIKRKLNPMCEHCERYGVAKDAELVDHIVEIEDGGAPLDMDNLQSLCHQCHNIKTAEEKRKRHASNNQPTFF